MKIKIRDKEEERRISIYLKGKEQIRIETNNKRKVLMWATKNIIIPILYTIALILEIIKMGEEARNTSGIGNIETIITEHAIRITLIIITMTIFALIEEKEGEITIKTRYKIGIMEDKTW